MIKTGRVGNIVLGVGDPSKFNLLGGSFGKAGDVIISGSGAGARLVVRQRDTMMRAGGSSGGGWTGGGSGPPLNPGPGRPIPER